MNRPSLTLLAGALFALTLGSCATGPSVQLPQVRRQAALHTERGVAAFTRGDRETAREEFKEAYRLNASVDNRDGMASALINLSRLHRLAGDKEGARQAAVEALSLKPSSPLPASELRFELAKISMTAGTLKDARQWAEQGLALTGEEQGSRFLNLLAQMDLREGAWESAERRAAAALKSSAGSGEREEEANARMLMGAIRLGRGDAAMAADQYGTALELSRESGTSSKVAAALRGLAQASRAKGDRSAALGYYERAYLASLNGGEAQEAAADLLTIADIHQENGNQAGADLARKERKRLLEQK